MKLTDMQSKLYHSHTIRNREEINLSEYCHCICCTKSYPSPIVINFIKDGDGETALCPYCGIDSIIGDSCGLEINQEILTELNKRWF